jgi:hypothetical protein
MNAPHHRRLIAFAFVALLAIAACGGSTVAVPPAIPVATVTATPTPIAAPTSSPVTVVQQQAVALPAATVGATPEPVALPSAAGFAPTMLLPLPASATALQLTVLVSNVAPQSAPPFAVARRAQAIRRVAALPAGSALLLYTELYVTVTLTLPAAPGFLITIPSDDVLAGAKYYLALYDLTRAALGWQYDFAGPAVVTQSTLAFAGAASPFVLAADTIYAIALFAEPQGNAPPTPAPSIAPVSVPPQSPPPLTATPTPSPGPASPAPGGSIAIAIAVPTAGPIACTPAPLTVAVGATLAVACSEPGYAGPFHPALDDPSLATIVVPAPAPLPSPAGAPPLSSPPPPSSPAPTPAGAISPAPTAPPAITRFTVTGVASGRTTLRLQSDNGATAAFALTVTP